MDNQLLEQTKMFEFFKKTDKRACQFDNSVRTNSLKREIWR